MRLACAGLFSWVERGATIITPTPLLAAVAAEQFSKQQLARGVESWQRRRIVQESSPDLFDGNSIARLASRSARLMCEWRIPADGDVWTNHEDARQFQEWYKRLRRECAEQGWITRSDLLHFVPQWLASGDCTSELTVFAGFPIFTPALESLRNVLGSLAHIASGTSQAAESIQVQSFPDATAEWEHAAR